jgi:hypothetical protein
MGLTQIEKQRRYRERHLGYHGKKERLQCIVSLHTKAKLTRLARYHGCSITKMLEILAEGADDTLIRHLPGEDINTYLDGRLQRNRLAHPALDAEHGLSVVLSALAPTPDR